MSDCPTPFLVVSIALFGFVLSLVIPLISLIARYVWSWIDEEELVYCPVIRAWAYLNGYRRFDTYRYYKSKEAVGDWSFSGKTQVDVFGVLVVQVFLISIGIGIAVVYPLTASVIGTIIAIAFLARFTRRLSKAYTQHVQDKNAHR